jgi:uncharacterized protein involved in type VI secretion and phage assembly
MNELCGFAPGIVVDNFDPENSGRVKVRLAGANGRGAEGHEVWARVSTLTAGDRRGTWLLPEVDDEVLVAFQSGEAEQHYVIGSLWSKRNSPPATNNNHNATKLLRLRSGLQITLSEKRGRDSFTIETPQGQKLALHDGPDGIEISDSSGNRVRLDGASITINAPAKVVINASTAEVNAGMLQVNAGIAKFSGVVQCDTLISNSVISSSYTPGAGNIL